MGHRVYGRFLSRGEMDPAGEPVFACVCAGERGDLAGAPPLGAVSGMVLVDRQ